MRIMYLILNLLYNADAKSKLIALTQKQIIEALKEDGNSWNERTIYNRLKEMLQKGYVGEGMKCGNAMTYYIRIEGINFMKEMESEETEDCE